MLEHPDITRLLTYGYPWPEPLDVDDPENDEWDDDTDEDFEDSAYDEKREREMGWID